MREDARKRRFDVLLVWQLNRLSRSLRDLLDTLASLEAWGIDFICYNDRALDTTTPTGKLVHNVLGSVAEFERDIIRERIKAGLENVSDLLGTCGRVGRQGELGGGEIPRQKTKLMAQILARGKELRTQRMSWRKIGSDLGLDEGTLRKALKRDRENKTAP